MTGSVKSLGYVLSEPVVCFVFQGFGVPLFFLPDDSGQLQMVWGCDRFEIIAKILGKFVSAPLKDTLNVIAKSQWLIIRNVLSKAGPHGCCI